MAAAKHGLTADRGGDLSLAVRYLDSSGEPVDLSGLVCTLVVLNRGEDPGDVLYAYAGECGADGWIRVTAPAAETTGWPAGRLAYRLELADAGTDALEFVLVGPLTVRTPADV